MLGTLGDEELVDRPVIGRLHLHGRLVGLDLGDHVAASDAVAFLDVPFDELALLHGGRELRHEDLRGHGSNVSARRRKRIFPMLPVEQADTGDADLAVIEATHVHAIAVGLRARHIEALYSAYGAE